MTSAPSPAVHLDTSFLIRALLPGSDEAMALRGWLQAGRVVEISTFVWGELLCGPLGEREEAAARRVVRRHLPLDTDRAAEAARLFNLAGRRRGSFSDCIVAATAIASGALLATADLDDFRRFHGVGLELLE